MLRPVERFEALRGLYEEVAEEVSRLTSRHAERLTCKRGCHDCCVDDLTVFAVEADHIRANAGAVLDEAPRAEGACAFLDAEGACRIYEVRPYVCRTQGLPLRWVEDDAEYRDICPLNEEGEPLVQIGATDCFTLGPFEGRLAELQRQYADGAMTRIGLRRMFD